MNSEEFEASYTQILDTLLKAFANSSEVKLEKFYSLASAIENLQHNGPEFNNGIIATEDK